MRVNTHDIRYTVQWSRLDYPSDGILTCSGLTQRDIVRRMIGAIKNTGPIVIHSIGRSSKKKTIYDTRKDY